jgi:hypothetical protein
MSSMKTDFDLFSGENVPLVYDLTFNHEKLPAFTLTAPIENVAAIRTDYLDPEWLGEFIHSEDVIGFGGVFHRSESIIRAPGLGSWTAIVPSPFRIECVFHQI